MEFSLIMVSLKLGANLANISTPISGIEMFPIHF